MFFSLQVETTELERDPLPVEGSIVRGFVSNTSGKGCFLRLSHAVTGHVLMKDLSDEFIDDPAAEFPMGKLVHARVLSVDQVLKSSNRAVVLGGFLPDTYFSAILYENVSVYLLTNDNQYR